MTFLLIVALVLLLCGGGYHGYRPGHYGGRSFGGGLGLIFLVLLAPSASGGFGGYHNGYR